MSANFTPTLGDVAELKPFRFWCQKVLPLVFDDTLSYYELLCKVVDYLNNTMNDVNTLASDVDNLHTAYQELQDYVNHYFDNLNVQNEIDAKLDEMAESGALTALINPLIPPAVAAWLADHITPTTPAVDNTLSVSGAAADAKVTGDKLKKCLFSSGIIVTGENVSSYDTLADLTVNNVYCYGTGAVASVTDAPKFSEGFSLLYFNYNPLTASGSCQIATEYTTGKLAVRTAITVSDAVVFSDWIYFSGGENLLDLETITEDKVLNFDGEEATSAYTSDYAISDYIAVEYADRIYMPYVHGYNTPGFCAYDANQNFLWSYAGFNGVDKETVTGPLLAVIPDRRVKYIRYNLPRNNQFPWSGLVIYKESGGKNEVLDRYLNYNTIQNKRPLYFNKLIDAINYVNDYNLWDRFIDVYAPNYQVANDFSADYYAAIPRLADQNIYAGYILKNNVTIRGLGNTRLKFTYSGTYLNNVADNFSIFNVAGCCHLENLRLIAQNCKYVIHDDIGASGISSPPMFHFTMKDCTVTHEGISDQADYQYPCCIGGGCFSGSKHVIENCYFDNQGWSSDVSYHDSQSAVEGVQSVVIITGCYFTHRLRLADMTTATGDPIFVMLNNTSSASANTIGSHFDVKAFNNEVRT